MIGKRGKLSCGEIYRKVMELVDGVIVFHSDGNSCYEEGFKEYMPQEDLEVTKKETHLIESSNSSIRDNLARFNRKSKRASKTLEMLERTLELFFNRDKLEERFMEAQRILFAYL